MLTTRSLRFSLALLLGAFSATTAFAHNDHDKEGGAEHGSLVSAKDAPSDWLTKAQSAYPTDICVVSGDKLGGEMGKPLDYIYKEEGKPDRLVRFCCKDCIKDFKKDPDKYLGEIDKAAAKKSGASTTTAPAH